MNATDALASAVRYAARKHRSERRRMINAAVIAHEGGLSVATIAEAAGVHRSTVYLWLRDREPTGSLGGGSDH